MAADSSCSTGILGLNETGRLMLKAAVSTGLFQIKAVADEDLQAAKKTAAEYKCEAYSDYRQLVVQNQLDCLFVAAETHTCDEQIKTAIRRKFNILKAPPPARTFAEMLEYVELAENESVQFAVAEPGRFNTGYVTAHELISQGRLGPVFLIAACCSFDAADRPPWQIDPQVAGGGVLLHDCYQILDRILWDFPLPEQVYALKTNLAPDRQQRLSLTEDTAVMCMRFSDALMGNLVATRSRQARPDCTMIEIHGKEALLKVGDGEVVLAMRGDQEPQRWPCREEEQVLMERVMSSFAQSLTNPTEQAFPCSGRESLRNMAVLEAAYLSMRTGFPEAPARILQMAGRPSSAQTGI